MANTNAKIQTEINRQKEYFNAFMEKFKVEDKEPYDMHNAFAGRIKKEPLQVYDEIKSRFNNPTPLYTEMGPEFAPVVHFLKKYIHSESIDAACLAEPVLKQFRLHADLALWHVSTSQSWYPYYPTLKAIFLTLQFLDTLIRHNTPELNKHVPFYHEFRYMYYFDWIVNQAPHAIIIPTFSFFGATDLVLTRGPPIFIVGVNVVLEFVDEYIQTPAEFFIHDINHSRRQYVNGLEYYQSSYKNLPMTLDNFYKYQVDFMNEKIRPLLTFSMKDSILPTILADTSEANIRGMRAIIKIILFEVLHEEADPALPEVICGKILKDAGEPSPFQFIFTNPETGQKNIRKVIVPGGSILSFVRYKLRYGFLNAPGKLDERIAPRQYRTSEKIAEAAKIILLQLKCKDIPSDEKIKELVNSNEGLNPPQHPNHLGNAFNIKTFTGVRPQPIPTFMFEKMYEGDRIPWSGVVKKETELEDFSKIGLFRGNNNALETAKPLKLEANANELSNNEGNQEGGKRKTKARKTRKHKKY